MTLKEKKMKAAAIAVSYYLLTDQDETLDCKESEWSKLGLRTAMDGREFIQRKGGNSRFSK